MLTLLGSISTKFNSATQVCFLHPFIHGKVFGRTGQDYLAIFQDITPVCNLKGSICILFNKQYRCAPVVDFTNCIEDNTHKHWREPQAWLIK